MPQFAQNQIEEINAIIKAIESELKPKMEIGAKDPVILAGLLRANKIKKVPKSFKCKREYSETIVSYFVKEKGVPRNKFSSNLQTAVFII
jgi:hypothetical protein